MLEILEPFAMTLKTASNVRTSSGIASRTMSRFTNEISNGITAASWR
jgi:hypothetical protein